MEEIKDGLITNYPGISLTPDNWDATIGSWIIGEPEKSLEEKIQRIEIDMYKDRFKTCELFMRLIFIFKKEETEMKKSEKIEILEKEVTRLNELLDHSSARQFERLKEEMEQEVAELKEYKERYRVLIEEVEGLKVELENNIKNLDR